jgi:hypothetical protein
MALETITYAFHLNNIILTFLTRSVLFFRSFPCARSASRSAKPAVGSSRRRSKVCPIVQRSEKTALGKKSQGKVPEASKLLDWNIVAKLYGTDADNRTSF